MGWFERFRLRRAVRRYARYVPAALRKGWGKSEFYTPGQVESVLNALKMTDGYQDLARAVFLTETDFLEASDGNLNLSYDEIRDLFFSFSSVSGYGQYEHAPLSDGDAVNRYGVGWSRE
ncbi:DUF6559 family protein [Asticcacaulis sp. YBE204]|uniref:DUF6559 family protein n=1 Tax=Asticcacaulis sp. YBE204 TaxID=1282363 RepID=UPI0003C3D4A0|nr:DUF6559 family protein [Asticcacaulis sp. YBE204]ESQ78254.1 hypothetical protein AEYBE204_15575 [Asticcacaulis sp. YBE204]